MAMVKKQMPVVNLRRGRALFVLGVCALLVYPGCFSIPAVALQTQQQYEQQQREEQQREEQQRQQQEEQERQQQQEEQQRQQEQQREEQQQEQQRQQQQEEQQRQQEQQREEHQQEQQRQQQEEQQRQQQQEQQRAQEAQQQREAQQQQRQQQERQQSQHREQPGWPVLQTRPVNPEPFRPEPRPLRPEPEPHPEPGLELRPEPRVGPFIRPPLVRPVAPRRPYPAMDGNLLRLPPPRPRFPERTISRRPPIVVVGRPEPASSSTSVSVILGLAPPRGTVVIPVVVAPAGAVAVVAPQAQYAVAQQRVQQAEAGCAQADAYQNYVNQAVNSQNTLDQSTDQVLQSLAGITTDPNVQSALLDSMNQPNPINDALDQQLQNLAATNESICQQRLAAAEAALPPDPSQQTAGPTQAGVPAQAGVAPDQSDSGDPAEAQAEPTSSSGQGSGAGAGAPQPGSCPQVATANIPAAIAPWGAWVALGNTGLVFDVSRVDAKTLTWRFLNAGTSTIAAMQFNYAYVDADTGQPATASDLLPFALAPGQSVGGWTAYTANTRGNITISITQISCQ